MPNENGSRLHPEYAKLVSALVSFFGVVVTSLGVVMLVPPEYESLKELSGSLTILWAGFVMILAGRSIRRTGVLMRNPKWFLSGFLFGVVSIYGLFVGLSQGDVVKVILFLLIQLFSAYAIWRSCLLMIPDK